MDYSASSETSCFSEIAAKEMGYNFMIMDVRGQTPEVIDFCRVAAEQNARKYNLELIWRPRGDKVEILSKKKRKV